MDYKSILAANGWTFSRTCSACGGTKHEWKNSTKTGWILYVWPGLRMFRVVDNNKIKKAEGSFSNMNEKLSEL